MDDFQFVNYNVSQPLKSLWQITINPALNSTFEIEHQIKDNQNLHLNHNVNLKPFYLNLTPNLDLRICNDHSRIHLHFDYP